MRKEAERWWLQALEDLSAARANLRIGKFYVAAFFSQQAAEKALEALYIETKRRTQPKTHDLTELAAELRVPKGIAEDLAELNPEFVVTRYPDAANGVPARMYTREIAKFHVGKAGRVVKWAKQRLLMPRRGSSRGR
jgi:HEPN domain-containing protein